MDGSVVFAAFSESVDREDVDDNGDEVGCPLGCSENGDETMSVGTLGLFAGIGGEEVALLILWVLSIRCKEVVVSAATFSCLFNCSEKLKSLYS